MKRPDFKGYCLPCGAWCCNGENPYASTEELKRLGVTVIGQKPDGTCTFLGESNLCIQYENRPFECRSFPLDAKDGNWVYWPSCAAASAMDLSAHIDEMEKELMKHPKGYIDDYMDHHRSNEPKKYESEEYLIIRPINQVLRR